MNYELAKQLKDAGFPQNPNGVGYSCFEPRGEYCDLPEAEHDEKCTDYDCQRLKVPDIYPPTLSELIEACGKGFYSLRHYLGSESMAIPEHWMCYTDEKNRVFNSRLQDEYQGDTPEEAVAKAWISLNKK